MSTQPPHPDEILANYDALVSAGTGAPILVAAGREVLWQVINDVCSSYELALLPLIGEDITGDVNGTVYDYLSTHYGDE